MGASRAKHFFILKLIEPHIRRYAPLIQPSEVWDLQDQPWILLRLDTPAWRLAFCETSNLFHNVETLYNNLIKRLENANKVLGNDISTKKPMLI